MASSKLVLDLRRVRKDNTCPLVLRFVHERNTFYINTHILIAQEHWDESFSKVTPSHPHHAQLNLRLRELEFHYSGKVLELYREFPHGFSFVQLKAHLTSENKEVATVREFWVAEIELLQQAQKHGNARVHRISLAVISKEVNLDIPFERVNYTFLKNLESMFLRRGLKTNSIGVYMRNLRSIYNTAINKDVVEATFYPFKKYKIKSEKVVPHVMTKDELRRFFGLQLPETHHLYKAWLLGKLSFLLGGINFNDLVLLTTDSIKQGRVVYKRSKTKKLYSIRILDHTKQILDVFLQKNQPTICNVLSNDELQAGERLPYIIRDKNKQFNKKLAAISKMIGCSVTIRSYTFRYTIANICKQMGYDIAMISELLGHSYGSSVTSGYLMAFDKDKLDAMLGHVCNVVTAKE